MTLMYFTSQATASKKQTWQDTRKLLSLACKQTAVSIYIYIYDLLHLCSFTGCQNYVEMMYILCVHMVLKYTGQSKGLALAASPHS